MSADSAPLTLVQLSDLHIGHPGALAAASRALAHVEHADVRPAALILSGDLADAGRPAEYEALRAVLDPVVARLGTRLVVAAGNHDDRAALRRHLLGSAPTTDPLDHVAEVDGLRIVTLDSTVPGHQHGAVAPDRLAWLAGQLAHRAPRGTLLVLHHPPVPTAFAPMRGHDLHDPDGLAVAVAGTDVRMILCGHTHHAGAAALDGVPVWIAPSTSHRAELLSPPGRVRGLPWCAVTRVDVHPRTVVAALEPVPDPAVAPPPEVIRYAAQPAVERAACGNTRPVSHGADR